MVQADHHRLKIEKGGGFVPHCNLTGRHTGTFLAIAEANAAHRLGYAISSRQLGVWPVWTVGRGAEINNSWVYLDQVLVTAAKTLGHAGAEVLGEDIGILHQLVEYLSGLIFFQVQRDALETPVVGLKVRADWEIGCYAKPSAQLTSRWFYLDYLGSQVGHHAERDWCLLKHDKTDTLYSF